jgi:hypothetical protein
VAEDLVASTD